MNKEDTHEILKELDYRREISKLKHEIKIKDNINLKELEKFGFEQAPCGDYILKFQDTYTGAISIRVFTDKMVYPKSDLDIYNRGNKNEIEMFDTLYDLIKADLVEKVEE